MAKVMGILLQVKTLRDNLSKRSSSVPSIPGYYIWWFDKEGTDLIASALKDNASVKLFQKKKIRGRIYYALYLGIAKNLLDRIKWHICQNHSCSSIKSGYLSTLRQSISAILKKDMSSSECKVNAFFDDHCYWEYFQTNDLQTAESEEIKELGKEYYILNIQKNKVVNKDTKTRLKQLRKKYKK